MVLVDYRPDEDENDLERETLRRGSNGARSGTTAGASTAAGATTVAAGVVTTVWPANAADVDEAELAAAPGVAVAAAAGSDAV